jgi:hypothetical protein
MTLQQPGILPCSLKTCCCNASLLVASGFGAIAIVVLKTGIIREE